MSGRRGPYCKWNEAMLDALLKACTEHDGQVNKWTLVRNDVIAACPECKGTLRESSCEEKWKQLRREQRMAEVCGAIASFASVLRFPR